MDPDSFDRDLDQVLAGGEPPEGSHDAPELELARGLARLVPEPPPAAFAYTAFKARMAEPQPQNWLRIGLRRALVPGLMLLLIAAVPLIIVLRRSPAPETRLAVARRSLDRCAMAAAAARSAPVGTPEREQRQREFEQSLAEAATAVGAVEGPERADLDRSLGDLQRERQTLSEGRGSPSPSPSPSITPTVSPTVSPSESPSPTASPTPTPSPTPTASPSPTNDPTGATTSSRPVPEPTPGFPGSTVTSTTGTQTPTRS